MSGVARPAEISTVWLSWLPIAPLSLCVSLMPRARRRGGRPLKCTLIAPTGTTGSAGYMLHRLCWRAIIAQGSRLVLDPCLVSTRAEKLGLRFTRAAVPATAAPVPPRPAAAPEAEPALPADRGLAPASAAIARGGGASARDATGEGPAALAVGRAAGVPPPDPARDRSPVRDRDSASRGRAPVRASAEVPRPVRGPASAPKPLRTGASGGRI